MMVTNKPDDVLRRYHALEPGADISDFQWRARLLQSLWREERHLPIGDHNGRPSGARIAMPFAKETLSNYLTANIRELVRKEVDGLGRDRAQLYGRPRIYNNLLSSQPLSFNLFGELSADLALATKVIADMTAGRFEKVCEIEFEFSPGRRNVRYTGDASAYDVYVRCKTSVGSDGFLGIEVKYHENMKSQHRKEKDYYSKHGGRYEQLAETMGCFRKEELVRVRGTRLQQLWRDHLLVGAQNLADGFADASFILLHPRGNRDCAKAAQEYKRCLSDERSFEVWTMEDFVARLAMKSDADWIREFQRRYLDFARLPV